MAPKPEFLAAKDEIFNSCIGDYISRNVESMDDSLNSMSVLSLQSCKRRGLNLPSFHFLGGLL